MTVTFIVINAAVFIYQLFLGPRNEENFVFSYALIPARLFADPHAPAGVVPAGVTLFTSMFLHGSLLHVAGNMLYLWIFGNNIEDSMSRIRFVVFYLVCGIVAAYSHAITATSSTVPMVGASGAVSGVLGAYLLLYPRARVLTLIPLGFYMNTIEIPAIVVLGLWFILQFLNALVSSSAGGGVAWYAHVGGFIAGIALIGLFKRRNVPFWGRRRYDYL